VGEGVSVSVCVSVCVTVSLIVTVTATVTVTGDCVYVCVKQLQLSSGNFQVLQIIRQIHNLRFVRRYKNLITQSQKHNNHKTHTQK